MAELNPAPGSADQSTGQNPTQSGEAIETAKSPFSGNSEENTGLRTVLEPSKENGLDAGKGVKPGKKKPYRGTKARPIKEPKRYRSFVDAYLQNGCNSKKAFELTYGYTPSGGGNATRVRQSETVGQELKRHWDSERLRSIVTVENVLGKLAELSETASRDADKVRCLELLGKYLDLWKSETVQHNTLIVAGDLDQIRQRIAARQAQLSTSTDPQQTTEPSNT